MIIELIKEAGMLLVILFFGLVFMDIVVDLLNLIDETIQKIRG